MDFGRTTRVGGLTVSAKKKTLWTLVLVVLSMGYATACRRTSDDAPRGQAGRPLSAEEIAEIEDNDSGLPVTPELDAKGLKIGPFDLADQDGKPFDPATLKGQVYVVDFFFTACPVQCPKLSQAFERLQHALGDRGLRLLSISVDPDNDTRDVLQRYAKKYNANPSQWTFLTGEQQEVERVAHEVFRVPLQDRLHTEKFILVDRQGEIAGFYRGLDALSLRELEHRAAELLQEPGDEDQS